MPAHTRACSTAGEHRVPELLFREYEEERLSDVSNHSNRSTGSNSSGRPNKVTLVLCLLERW